MAKAITGQALTKFKANPSRRVEIPDGVLPGLYFVIQPSGHKSWAVRYRVHSRTRKLTLGNYLAGTDAKKAGTELTRVRSEAGAVLERVRQGDDPAAVRQTEKRAARNGEEIDRHRFENVVRIFLVRYAKPKNRSWKETARTLGLVPDKAKPDAADDPKAFVAVKGGLTNKWGHRPVGDITRAEIIGILDDIVDRGAPILANRTLAALRKLFNWAVQRDLIATSPCAGIKPPAAEKSRDRVLSDDELRALWKASEAMGWPFGRAVQMLILTAQRRDEVREMKWRELDIPNKTWTLPRERVKTDKAHAVPLSTPALSVLEELPRVAGGGYVFTTTGQTPISGFSKAKEALDSKMLLILQDDDAASKLAPWRLHDIRRTAASGMARLGISLAVIEKILNHTSGSFGGIVGVYQRHEFSDEKRRALDAWASFVASLVEDKPAENVVPMMKRS